MLWAPIPLVDKRIHLMEMLAVLTELFKNVLNLSSLSAG